MQTAIDLFSGAGGFSLGFQKAGTQVLYGIDNNQASANTHQKNIKGSKSLVEDLSIFGPNDFAKLTGICKDEISIIFGSPPCQTFSNIGVPKIKSLKGKEIKNDKRNFLFVKFFDFIKFFSPKAFVLENVPQFESRAGNLLKSEIDELSNKYGYTIKSRVLDAVNYGVPQKRKRIFFVGLKHNSNFEFPSIEFCELDNPKLLKPNTVNDAIGDLPKIKDGARENLLPYSKNSQLSNFQKKCRNVSGLVGNNICRVSNERAKRVFKHMKMGDKYKDLPSSVKKILPFRDDIFYDRLKRLHLKKPSWTVLAHIGMDGYMYIHPTQNRTLSVREAARIQSFPDSFEFIGNMREQYIQVGNSVPVILAQQIAKKVLHYL